MMVRPTTSGTRKLLATLGMLALGASACAGGMTRTTSEGAIMETSNSAQEVRATLAAWPQEQRETAMELMQKYGQPAVISDHVLIWYDNGPFVRTELHRNAAQHNFPMQHPDYLTQTVRLSVPAGKLAELHEYDGSVWHHRTRGELSAQCDVEAMNLLELNLSHDIIAGKRTVSDARDFYAKTAMAFKGGDRSSPYVTGLIFQPQPNAADPDRPHQR